MPRPICHFLARLALALAATCCVALAGCSNAGPRLSPGLMPADQARNLNEAVSLAARGDKALEHGNMDDALEHYRKSVQAYDGFAAAWNNMGVVLMSTDDFAAAEEAFIRAAMADPSDPARATTAACCSWSAATRATHAAILAKRSAPTPTTSTR